MNLNDILCILAIVLAGAALVVAVLAYIEYSAFSIKAKAYDELLALWRSSDDDYRKLLLDYRLCLEKQKAAAEQAQRT